MIRIIKKYFDYAFGLKDGILDRCFSPLKHSDFYVSGYKEGILIRKAIYRD